jgi:hypothetical protein
MKIKILAIIFIISIFSVLTLQAQDCSLNGAPATDDCPAGTAGDDVFIITGEVNTSVLPSDGNDTIIMIGGGSISPLPNGSGVFTTTTSGDIIVIGGSIITVSVQGVGIFEKLDGTVLSSTMIITSGDGGRGIQEENDGDAINNGSIITSGNISGGGVAAHGLRETNNGNAINNGIIITSGEGAAGIAEHGDGDAINNGSIIVTGIDANGIEEVGNGDVINNGTVNATNYGILTDNSASTVTNNGTVTGGTAAIQTGAGNDVVINNGTANGNINLGAGDDTMVISGVVIGVMDGGADTDTLIFTVTVIGSRQDRADAARAIANANPAGGTIYINGVAYTWLNFENLVNLLNFIDSTRYPCATDGRINDYDCHAPIAIYGYPLQIYGIDPDTSEGHYGFTLSQEMIDAAGIPETGTILIYEGFHPVTGVPIAIYRHWTGDFQINTYFPDGKLYVGLWSQYGGYVNLSGEFNN